MAFILSPPPAVDGDAREGLKRTYSYLYQLAETLNGTLNRLTVENMAPEAAEAIKAAAEAAKGNQNGTASKQQERLKALIVKTAKTVELTMDEMEKHLALTYLAKGDFGQYLQLNEATIKATAQGVVQSFTGHESAESFQEHQASFTAYVTETQQYIRSGYLYDEVDANGVSYPRYGVAVGERLTTVEVDGKEVLNRSGYVVTHTSDEVAFWVNEVTVAYINNGKLYVAVIEVTDRIVLGYWEMALEAGGTLKIGGGPGEFVLRFESGKTALLEKGEEIFRAENREMSINRARIEKVFALGTLQMQVLTDGKIRAAVAE